MGDPFWQHLVDIESSYKRLRGQSHPQFKGDLGGIDTLVRVTLDNFSHYCVVSVKC